MLHSKDTHVDTCCQPESTVMQEVEAFAQQDVYMTAGLVTSYTVKPFQIVVDGQAPDLQ